MIATLIRRFRASRVAPSIAVWLGVALLAWLDQDRCLAAHHAALVSWVIQAAIFIWNGVQAIKGYIGVSLEAVLHWCVEGIGWLSKTLADFMQLAGGMFARVWDALETLWQKTIRPVLIWLDEQIMRLHGWLQNVMSPVLDWLRRVRDFIDDIYRRFVRPVLDLIDFIHRLDQLLNVFHIDVLDGLDRFLQRVQRWIDDAFGFVYGWLARLGAWVDYIVTADGFFQRYTLLRSQWRYVKDGLAQWWVAMHRTLTGEKRAEYQKKPESVNIARKVAAMREYLERGTGPDAARINEHAQDLQIRLRNVA